MEKTNTNWLDDETLPVPTDGDAEAQATLKPWHAPQVTALEIRSTLFGGGSLPDGTGPSTSNGR